MKALIVGLWLCAATSAWGHHLEEHLEKAGNVLLSLEFYPVNSEWEVGLRVHEESDVQEAKVTIFGEIEGEVDCIYECHVLVGNEWRHWSPAFKIDQYNRIFIQVYGEGEIDLRPGQSDFQPAQHTHIEEVSWGRIKASIF